jgi:hypothetical protein
MFATTSRLQCLLVLACLVQPIAGQRAVAQRVIVIDQAATEARPEIVRERESIISQAITDMLYRASLARLDLEIEEYRREAKLTDTQLKRLTLAAKGAATQFAEKQAIRDLTSIARHVLPEMTMMDAGQRLVRLPVAGGVPEPVKPRGREEEEPQIDLATVFPKISVTLSDRSTNWNVRKDRGSSGIGRSGGFDKVIAHPIWRKAIDKNSTAEQREIVLQRRQELLVESAADFYTAIITARINLDDSQQKLVRQLIRQHFAAEKLNVYQFANRGAGLQKVLMTDQNNKQLKTILSEAQWAAWEQQKVSYRNGSF